MDDFNGYSWEDSGTEPHFMSSRFQNNGTFWNVYNGLILNPGIKNMAIQAYNLGVDGNILSIHNEYLFTAHIKGLIDGIVTARPELN